MCVSVAMVTKFTKQQNNTQSCIGPMNLCTKYELHRPSDSRVMCVSVAMVTRFRKQQNNTQSCIGPMNLCTKYELHRPSNSRVMNVCICCHGSKA